MKERPILFSGPMVRALLEGRKTQTRRIVVGCVEVPGEYSAEAWGRGEMPRCPYGEPGERLWVRERINLVDDYTAKSIYDADGTRTKADAWPWRRRFLPPMHCPRGLSRINLRVTSVRVERLQAITDGDERAEGIDPATVDEHRPHRFGFSPRESFAALWDSINGERASWDSNPWVWVVGFEVIP